MTYTDLHRIIQKVLYKHIYELPTLSDAARQLLDAPLTLEELQVATGMFPNSKAPGEDEIPAEVYKQYDEQLLPKLLRVFNGANTNGGLPTSMSKAIIVLLLKPGKDPLDPGFFIGQ